MDIYIFLIQLWSRLILKKILNINLKQKIFTIYITVQDINKEFYDEFKKNIKLDKKRIIEHYDIWIDVYKHIYDKFSKKGINLDSLYKKINPWKKITEMRLKRLKRKELVVDDKFYLNN